MLPDFTAHDPSDVLSVHAEFARYCRRCASPFVVTSTDFSDLAFGQLMHAMALTSGMPTLGDHVCMVIGSGTEEQVLGVTAGRIVAAVQHEQAIRNRTVRQLPGRHMYPSGAGTPHNSVLLWITEPGPFDTSVWLKVRSSSEPFCDTHGRRKWLSSHCGRSWFRAPRLCSGRVVSSLRSLPQPSVRRGLRRARACMPI